MPWLLPDVWGGYQLNDDGTMAPFDEYERHNSMEDRGFALFEQEMARTVEDYPNLGPETRMLYLQSIAENLIREARVFAQCAHNRIIFRTSLEKAEERVAQQEESDPEEDAGYDAEDEDGSDGGEDGDDGGEANPPMETDSESLGSSDSPSSAVE